jgi:hypothetical protein
MTQQPLQEQPPSHPPPPNNFKDWQLPIIESAGPFYRINSCLTTDGRECTTAINFTRTGNGRWDGRCQGYRICYTGADSFVCFIECYGRTGTLASQLRSLESGESTTTPEAIEQLKLGKLLITEEELSRRFLAEINTIRPLKFVAVTTEGLSSLRADARLASGSYEMSRKWGIAFHEHPEIIDGICYRSRHDDDLFCYAIFERARENLTETNCGTLITQRSQWLDNALRKYNCLLIDNQPVTGVSSNDIVT